MADKSKSTNGVLNDHAPSYDDLYSLVQELRMQVRTLSEAWKTDGLVVNGSVINRRTESNVSSRTAAVPNIRIVTDLNKSVKEFTGRETSYEDEDRLASVESSAILNSWPVRFKF